MEGICNSTVYARESEASHLPSFYYLVSWKDYLKDKNIWEFASAMQHLRKLVSTFYKNYFNKPTAISLPIDLATLIDKRIALFNINSKRKHDQFVGSVRKKVKH